MPDDTPPTHDGLSLREASFVAFYTGDAGNRDAVANAAESARLAGYSASSASALTTAGHRLLNRPAVQTEIATRVSTKLASPDGDAVRQALARLAMSDMSNFLSVEETEDGKGKLVVDCEKALEAAALGQIRSLRITKAGDVVLRLHDPLPALTILAKVFGLLKDHVEVSGSFHFNPIEWQPSEDPEAKVRIIRNARLEDLDDTDDDNQPPQAEKD